MLKKTFVATIVALALTGCVPAHADTRVAGTAGQIVVTVGNTEGSVPEVREALDNPELRGVVASNLNSLLGKSEAFGTSFEFERDLFVCETLHPVPADHAPDHPGSAPLAECVRGTMHAYLGGAK